MSWKRISEVINLEEARRRLRPVVDITEEDSLEGSMARHPAGKGRVQEQPLPTGKDPVKAHLASTVHDWPVTHNANHIGCEDEEMCHSEAHEFGTSGGAIGDEEHIHFLGEDIQ